MPHCGDSIWAHPDFSMQWGCWRLFLFQWHLGPFKVGRATAKELSQSSAVLKSSPIHQVTFWLIARNLLLPAAGQAVLCCPLLLSQLVLRAGVGARSGDFSIGHESQREVDFKEWWGKQTRQTCVPNWKAPSLGREVAFLNTGTLEMRLYAPTWSTGHQQSMPDWWWPASPASGDMAAHCFAALIHSLWESPSSRVTHTGYNQPFFGFLLLSFNQNQHHFPL